MDEKLIVHIKRKLFEKNEVYDPSDMPTDEQIRYFMQATFSVVERQCVSCFFCMNYKRFSFGSMCKIKSDTKENCFHFTFDITKVVKKKYYHILLCIDESTGARRITTDRTLSARIQKDIIYESVRLYEMIQSYKYSIRTSQKRKGEQ